jgi:hypothetical protein
MIEEGFERLGETYEGEVGAGFGLVSEPAPGDTEFAGAGAAAAEPDEPAGEVEAESC